MRELVFSMVGEHGHIMLYNIVKTMVIKPLMLYKYYITWLYNAI